MAATPASRFPPSSPVVGVMDDSLAPPAHRGLFLSALLPAWGWTLMLLSIVASVVRAVVGESQPLVKAILGVCMGVLFALGGAAHYAPSLVPLYVAMIPPAVPASAEMVVPVSGVVELVSGIELGITTVAGGDSPTAPRLVAAWAVVAPLVGISPANVYVAADRTCRAYLGVSRAAALSRLPLQLTLIVLAHWYRR